ncbi:hypothetical protein RRG08_027766 [Elysia crispata]|uniref:Uncharacterized protein n=1 Tax=Elysia crispata TaxID=231223 RepID=A0AAE0Z9D4_9GAST|nr:hypothetical protein RRG08_027766 [Elysia crispata]
MPLILAPAGKPDEWKHPVQEVSGQETRTRFNRQKQSQALAKEGKIDTFSVLYSSRAQIRLNFRSEARNVRAMVKWKSSALRSILRADTMHIETWDMKATIKLRPDSRSSTVLE